VPATAPPPRRLPASNAAFVARGQVAQGSDRRCKGTDTTRAGELTKLIVKPPGSAKANDLATAAGDTR